MFGFVTNGFNVAGIITPLVCGALMDHGEPRMVFLVLACFALLAVAVVVLMPDADGLKSDLRSCLNCSRRQIEMGDDYGVVRSRRCRRPPFSWTAKVRPRKPAA